MSHTIAGTPVASTAQGRLVVMSTLLVPPAGTAALEEAFVHRLGAVDGWDGHYGLEVWRDLHVSGRFAMTSWWSDTTSFARYMRSSDHAASHARVPGGAGAPQLESLHRYQVVSL